MIDKDLAGALLAKVVGADIFLILTDVDGVYLNYKKPDQKLLEKVNIKEARKFLKEGQFPPGSMGPKIGAAIDFLESDGEKVIIARLDKLEKALQGVSGTQVTKY